MRPVIQTRQLDAADPDGIATSQTPLGAGNLTLDGAFATGGVATLDVQRRGLITSLADESARTFTFTGTDDQGRVITEAVAGPNISTAQTVLDFKTVTQIAVDAATAGAIEVGTSGVGSSAPVPLDQYISPFNVSLGVVIGTSTVNVTVQYTFDDVFADDGAGPFAWTNHPDLTAVVADADGTFISPVTACRLLTNSGIDEAILRIVQAGLT